MRKRSVFLAALLVALGVVHAAAAPARLEDSFAHPPDEAKPWVYWFWADGNLTRAGITADLEAMQRVGLGGALIMEVDQDVPRGPVRFLSPAWRERFDFAVAEAARLGLKIVLNNDAGWTGSGGPWIDGAHSMQKVVWSETRVTGPRRFTGTIAAPDANAGFYRDIALLAFPTPAAETGSLQTANVKITLSAGEIFEAKRLIDGDHATGVTLPPAANADTPRFVQLEFAAPFAARTLEVTLAPGAPRVRGTLRISPDGHTFRDVAQFSPGGAPVTFDLVRARFFRVEFAGGPASRVALPLNEIALSAVHRVEHFAAKSGLGLVVSPDDVTFAEPDVSVDRARVVELTSRLHDSRLEWDVPPGDWTLLRLGHTSTGATNHPAPAEGKGLEVDKLSRAALDGHYDAFAGRLVRELAPAARPALATVHVDSWEVGYQNWTPEFRAEFQRRRGYDPLTWLPAFTGRVMGSEALTERFLWDVRRTISELLNDNYATRLAERAHADGRQFSLEAYRYGPFDCLGYAGRADLPVGEFWTTRDPATLHPSVKTMASAGHIYGRNVIAAEAFTATDALGKQRNHPYSLKAIGDAAFCAGINHFIFHRYAAQPWVDDRRPGMTMGPWGVEYERTATWWEETKPWHEYLARCQYLLRQGKFGADLCYLQSEEGFNNPATPAEIKPAVPAGYDFDFCSDEVVRTGMSVEHGRLVLPDGMGYRVLILPSQRLMTPALLGKIRDLVRAGAVVYGPPPRQSPSLAGYPECDEAVRRLVAELWVDCDCNGAVKLERSFGQGKVIWGVPLEQVLAKLQLDEDFAWRPAADAKTNAAPAIRYLHRVLPDRELYFVANLSDAPARIVASFRSAALAPELWRADTGGIQAMPVYDVAEGRVRVPLELDARGSVFVVFKHDAPARADRIVAVRKDGAVQLETGAVDAAPKPPAGPGFVDVAENFTIAAWVKPAADTALPVEDFAGTGAYSVARNDLLFPPPAHEVFGRRDVAGAGLAVGRNGVTVLEHGDHHFPATLVYRRAITEWTHVAVVFAGGVPHLYLDGERVRTGLKTALTVHGGVGVPHGRDVEPFRGEHSMLQQFSRALSAPEVKALMQVTPRDPVASVAAGPSEMRASRAPLRFDGAMAVWVGAPGRYELTRADGRRQTLDVSDPPPARAIEGAWRLSFPAGWGAPASVELPRLISCSEHADPGVRYFSGTATYAKTFDLPSDFARADRRVWLDLGDVQVIAEVKLNGRAFAPLWKPPFRVDVTEALRAGGNALEVRVTNLWVNRLIGDEQLPDDREWVKVPRRGGFALKAFPDWLQRGERSPTGRFTFATWKHYEKDAPLLRSGLLGPVMLNTEARHALEGAK